MDRPKEGIKQVTNTIHAVTPETQQKSGKSFSGINWKKIHAQEEKRKTKGMERIKRQGTQVKEFSLSTTKKSTKSPSIPNQHRVDVNKELFEVHSNTRPPIQVYKDKKEKKSLSQNSVTENQDLNSKGQEHILQTEKDHEFVPMEASRQGILTQTTNEDKDPPVCTDFHKTSFTKTELLRQHRQNRQNRHTMISSSKTPTPRRRNRFANRSLLQTQQESHRKGNSAMSINQAARQYSLRADSTTADSTTADSTNINHQFSKLSTDGASLTPERRRTNHPQVLNSATQCGRYQSGHVKTSNNTTKDDDDDDNNDDVSRQNCDTKASAEFERQCKHRDENGWSEIPSSLQTNNGDWTSFETPWRCNQMANYELTEEQSNEKVNSQTEERFNRNRLEEIKGQERIENPDLSQNTIKDTSHLSLTVDRLSKSILRSNQFKSLSTQSRNINAVHSLNSNFAKLMSEVEHYSESRYFDSKSMNNSHDSYKGLNMHESFSLKMTSVNSNQDNSHRFTAAMSMSNSEFGNPMCDPDLVGNLKGIGTYASLCMKPTCTTERQQIGPLTIDCQDDRDLSNVQKPSTLTEQDNEERDSDEEDDELITIFYRAVSDTLLGRTKPAFGNRLPEDPVAENLQKMSVEEERELERHLNVYNENCPLAVFRPITLPPTEIDNM